MSIAINNLFRPALAGTNPNPPILPEEPGPKKGPPFPPPRDGVEFAARTGESTTVECPEGTKPSVSPSGKNGVKIICEDDDPYGKVPD